MSERLKSVRNLAGDVLGNRVFQILLMFIFSLPLIATLGQYIFSGFILKNSDVLILFWPGVKKQFVISMPVLLSFGLMAASYAVGIAYMFRKGTFGKAVVLGFGGIFLAQFLGGIVNSIAGVHELQQVDSSFLNGAVDRAIFSLWHNPAWEEIAFRGLPLVILLAIKNKLSPKGYRIGIAAYFIIPSLAMVFYHVPNHGVSRIVDTLIYSLISAWLTLRYSFFAPLVLHYIFDALMIMNFGAIKGIDKAEVQWLVNNGRLLNNSFAFGALAILLSLPIIFFLNFRKTELFKQNKVKSVALTVFIYLTLVLTLFQFVD